jgi:hypothetical protein
MVLELGFSTKNGRESEGPSPQTHHKTVAPVPQSCDDKPSGA